MLRFFAGAVAGAVQGDRGLIAYAIGHWTASHSAAQTSDPERSPVKACGRSLQLRR